MDSNRIRNITFILSLILHALFILSFQTLNSIQLFSPNIKNTPVDEQEKQVVFEIVETPDDATSDKPPDKANLLSDKNSIARDQYTQKDKIAGDPYAMGDLDVKNIPNPASSQDAKQNELFAYHGDHTENNKLAQPAQDSEVFYQSQERPKFSRQELLRKSEQKRSQAQLDQPQYDSEKFNAREIGGLSFNTYQWDFAPYMLEMKRKVERNIFPPPAFTHMGLIEGESILRFKVLPNGEVRDLEVLKYIGHKSLMETSVNAIKNANPFKPLPSDFPENFLEVTASFTYYVRK